MTREQAREYADLYERAVEEALRCLDKTRSPMDQLQWQRLVDDLWRDAYRMRRHAESKWWQFWRRWSWLAAVSLLLLTGCTQAECEAGKIIGQHETVEFADAGQPWPCGEPEPNADGCQLVTERCEWPVVFDCGDHQIELTPDALTYVKGACRDEHVVRWK